MQVAAVAADRLVVPRGGEIDVDSPSRGGGRLQAAAHPRLTYRPELDAIRGIAVLIVLFQHFGLLGVGPENHRAGQVGVTLFFVLSGYLITGLLMAERRETGSVSLPRFYVRRMRRLFPALVFMVGVVAIAGLPGNPIPALTYTENAYQQLGGQGGSFLHTWTLAIEEQFYLLWPAVFVVLARWPRAMIIALVVVIALSFPPFVLQQNSALLGGALLAISGRRLPLWMGLAGWIGVVLAAVVPGPIDGPLMAIAILASVAVVAAPGPIGKARSLVRLGGISYGVYLWSYPIGTVAVSAALASSRVEALAWTMGGITASIGMAIVSERWVERRWRLRKVEAPHREPAPTVPSTPQSMPSSEAQPAR